MLKPSRFRRATFALGLAGSLLLSAGPVWAQSTPTETTDNTDSEEPDEEPELPEDQLVPPDDDPNFVPDPNEVPLEEDFLRMPLNENPWYWRLELRESLGGTSNVDQIAGGLGSASNRLTATGLLRYTFPTQTQLLLRSQAFMFNFFNVTERDQFLAIPLSLTATQWFNNFNVYAGYLPIFSSSLNRQDGNIQRFDQDFMAGGSYFLPIDRHYLFAGYQFDYLLAQSEDFRYLGNTLFAGYRHSFTDNLFLFVDGRVQPRGYTNTADFLDEWRLGAGAAVQWHIFRPWLILEARGDYNQIINLTSADRNAGIFSFGLNLITALQSQS